MNEKAKFAVEDYVLLAETVNVEIIGLNDADGAFLHACKRDKAPLRVVRADHFRGRWEYLIHLQDDTSIIMFEDGLVAHKPVLTCAKDVEALYG